MMCRMRQAFVNILLSSDNSLIKRARATSVVALSPSQMRAQRRTGDLTPSVSSHTIGADDESSILDSDFDVSIGHIKRIPWSALQALADGQPCGARASQPFAWCVDGDAVDVTSAHIR